MSNLVMQIIKNKEKIGNVLFAIGVFLELLVMVTDHSSFIELPFRGRFTHIAFAIFCIKILFTHYTKIQWAILAASGILGAASYLTCGDEYVIRAVVFIFAAKGIEVKEVLQMVLYGMLLGTVVIIGASLLGIAGNVKTVADFGRDGIETRYVLGFNHANNLHDVVWYLLAMVLLLTHEKWNWKHYLLATIGNVILFLLTASRNGMIAVQLLLLACLVICYVPDLKKCKLPYILGGGVVTILLWMTWLGGQYGAVNSPIAAFFDRFLNNRLEMIWEFAPISAWKIFPEGRDLSFVDNGFATLFFHYGYVVGSVYIVMLIYMLFRLYKKQDGVGLCVLVTTSFITFIETTFIFNTSLLCNMAFIVMMLCWHCKQEA